MSTLRILCKALLLALALPAAAAELHHKDRLLFDAMPKEVKEGDAKTIVLTPQAKWRWGWCAVTWPDGTVGEWKAEVGKNGKATLKMEFDKGKGKYVVEFLVQGELGPAVGAIVHVFCDVPVVDDPAVDYRWDKRPAAELEDDVFARINVFRKECGLKECVLEEKLVAISRDHANDMADNRFFAHISPTAGDMANRARVKYGWKKVIWGMPDRMYLPKSGGPVFVGEDLAYDNSPGAAMEAWLGSPGHRAVFMNRNVGHLGVGVRKLEANENGFLIRRIYFVATFALFADSDIEEAEREAAARAADAKAQPLFLKAEDMEAHDPPQAVKMYEEVVAKHPGTASAEKAAARVKELTGDPEWAAIEKKYGARREARGWVDRARMLLDNKKEDKAREWLEKTLKEHPETPEADEARQLLEKMRTPR